MLDGTEQALSSSEYYLNLAEMLVLRVLVKTYSTVLTMLTNFASRLFSCAENS
jgi:hypothetical protein